MPDDVKEVQNFLAEELEFIFKSDDPQFERYNGETFSFKVPSVHDRIAIEVLAGKLRREADPEGNGNVYSQHPAAVKYVEDVATFQHLMRRTDAPWAQTSNDKGKPVLDWAKIPDDAPVSLVVDQFNQELDKFRANGHKSK